MHVRHLTLADFRTYVTADVALAPGVTTFLGRNGEGKTNLVEAVAYLATLGSHRVSQDAPLVRFGHPSAVVRGAVVRSGRENLVELEIVPGRANRARLNGNPVRPREVLGVLRCVLFAPEDLGLVKGEPAARRTFLDDLLVARQPRWAAVRADYERIVRQRNALLRSAGTRRRARGHRRDGTTPPGETAGGDLATLEVWNEHLAALGAQLLYARLRLLRDLAPRVAQAYDAVSDSRSDARATYRSSLVAPTADALTAGLVPEAEELREALLATMDERRGAELERGVGLVGPHRDDVVLTLGELPAKGYASHGESWSFALALRIGAFRLLRHDLGDDPVLVLDDVFAELDTGRRDRLADLVADCEQVLVTAAVPHDVPAGLRGVRFHVEAGRVDLQDGPAGRPEERVRAAASDGGDPAPPHGDDPARPDGAMTQTGSAPADGADHRQGDEP